GAVPPRAEHDHRRAGEPDRGDDEAVAVDGRHVGVEEVQNRGQARVDEPEGWKPSAERAHAALALSWWRGCSRPRSARSVSARIRRSTSASVFAAVIWTRMPTSSRGTSG